MLINLPPMHTVEASIATKYSSPTHNANTSIVVRYILDLWSLAGSTIQTFWYCKDMS